jgi:hypothetical protein
MWKKCSTTGQAIVRYMLIGWWIFKATDTHSECVIITDSLRAPNHVIRTLPFYNHSTEANIVIDKIL